MSKDTLIVEFSNNIIAKHLLKINNKKEFIHTWISNNQSLNNKNFIFLFNQDCLRGRNFKKKIRIFNFYKKLSKLDKSITLNLIKRQNPNNNMSKKNKILFINFLLSNWRDYLTKKKIKKVVFSATPHLSYSFCIYIISKILKIKVYILESTKYLNYFYFSKNINKIKPKLTNYKKKNKEIEKYLNQFNSKKIPRTHDPLENENIFEIFKIVYSFTIRPFIKKKNLIDFFFKKQKSTFHNYTSFLPFDEKSLHSEFKDFFFYLKAYFKSQKIKHIYNSLVSRAFNFNTEYKYILFSANFQPEKSTCPDAGIYFDQYNILKKLNNFCKFNKSFKILYKEHPAQFNYKRFGFIEKNEIFYNKISKLKNIIFLRLDIDVKEVIQNSSLVATATSEIGAQSFLLNKYCVLFGSAWYEGLSNVIKVDFISQKKINQILELALKKNKKIFNKNEFFKLENKNNFYIKRNYKKINIKFVEFIKRGIKL